MVDRRTQIINAARDLMSESGAPALSVRAVARRAGIGASTLRHYFPTQQALYDATLGSALDHQLSDHRISDTGISPRQRLTECLQQFLVPPTEDEISRQQWLATLTTMVDPAGDPDRRRAWHSLNNAARRRVTDWVRILDSEGHLSRDIDRTVRFLLTLVDGISLGLAVTGAERISAEHAEQILQDGVAAVVTDRHVAG